MNNQYCTFVVLTICSGCTFATAPTVQPVTSEPPEQIIYSNLFDTSTITGSTISRYLASDIVEIGDSNTKKTVMIFTNFECVTCQTWLNQHWEYLQTSWIEPKKIRVRIAPVLLQKFSNSKTISIALSCSSRLGKGLAMYERLLQLDTIAPDKLPPIANELGINMAEYNQCIQDERIAKSINRRQAMIDKLEVKHVPAITIGSTILYGPINRSELEAILRL